MAFHVNKTASGVYVQATCEGCGEVQSLMRPTEEQALTRFAARGWVLKKGKTYHSEQCYQRQRQVTATV